MVGAPITIACVAEGQDSSWTWLREGGFRKGVINWEFFRISRRGYLDRLIDKPAIARIRAGLALRRAAKTKKLDLIVTHLPYCTAWMATFLGTAKGNTPHMAFAFNFTDLPTGVRRKQMGEAFRKVDRFVVFSRMERDLYAEYFSIPKEKLDRIYWGVACPIETPGPRTVDKPYFIAVGGEGRDYRTLTEAARTMPDTAFVYVVRPWSLQNVDLPPNVQVYTNISWQETWSLVYHAEASIIPLRDRRTPCGHVTLVGGMHLGKAHIVTESAGIIDYVENERTALLIAPGDPQALRLAIERLTTNREFANSLGNAGQAFAASVCSEGNTMEYFRTYLNQTFKSESY